MGALIDIRTGQWLHQHTGIGAGIDSFYETLFKGSILLGDDRLLAWYDEAYFAIMNNTLIEVKTLPHQLIDLIHDYNVYLEPT